MNNPNSSVTVYNQDHEAYSEVDPTKIVGSIGAGQDMIRLAGSDL